MILYKNVDIKYLESILTKGILSLNVSGNNNWDDGKRADNSYDVVYLFRPLTEENSFCNYGVALLEIDIPDDKIKKISYWRMIDTTENTLNILLMKCLYSILRQFIFQKFLKRE